jgi:putative membrane protein
VNPARKKIITLLSIIIPLAVAFIFGIRIESKIDFSFLPRIYASINSITFILLVVALVAILKGNKKLHEVIIKVCVVLTSIFLGLYITYHITTDSTPYGGEGLLKYFYFFILITHISLSVIVIPLVLVSLGWAAEKNFIRHKKIARVAMPVWMYVAFTGVLVYLLISPYYS